MKNYCALNKNIVSAAYRVFDKLGKGFLEKVYQNALKLELDRLGYSVTTEARIDVRYDGVVVGTYYADVLVDDAKVDNGLIIEIKACKSIIKPHIRQVKNYLKATGIMNGLIINFGRDELQMTRVFG